ncbi:hypothetical protein [Acidithiobacillus ferriphilus]|uniref:hypothetical protein n=1 Tax=Acidithiobacillus ferriphilus TaxID=1689834 RepID=UPI00232B35DC|nr:hypothetical protein [Acidithiobacillus ferriphilus]WCE94015.1 hypothetical protein PJU76_00310 [Acidithiobacillus ferriphilus]
MEKHQLEDASNGIWMCYSHGKLIDTDENTYTAAMLLTWKHIAELRAKLSQELGRDVVLTPRDLAQVPLPAETLQFLSLGEENRIIGDAIANSCIEQIWGRELARATRDALIELLRNAFSHGKAANATIDIQASYIEVSDNGQQFDSTTLTGLSGGGGSLSLVALREDHGATIVFRSEYVSGQNLNRLTLVRKPADISSATPCSVSIDHTTMATLHHQLQTLTACNTIYVLLPKYLALSDVFGFPQAIGRALPPGKKVILVGEHLSERVVEVLQKLGQHVEILNFED